MTSDSSKFRNAIKNSLSLLESHGLSAALRPLDDAIERAIQENLNDCVEILCNHASVLCDFSRNMALKWHYYELSLTRNPRSYTALYGLATASLEEGNEDVARQFAKRCYDVVTVSDDPLAHSMLDLINVHWPDIIDPTPP